MHLIASILTASLGMVAAAPAALIKRGPTDGQILNYALTLEHLEDTFYRQGLAMFSAADFQKAGFKPIVRKNIEIIAADEASHVKFLTTALSAAGAKPVDECTYAFGVTDVKSFVATASVLEGVGVSAYLGAAADIMNKNYLTAAGSILTVEARHSSYIRGTLKQVPFPKPFDDPLTYNQVYSLAAQFIKSCPSTNDPLPVKAFPKLTATGTEKTVMAGSTLVLSTPGTDWPSNSPTLYAAFITVLGPVFVEVKWVHDCWTVQVPAGTAGQSYLVLTKGNEVVTDETTVAGPAIVEVSS